MTPTYKSSYTFDIETNIPLHWVDVPYDGKWEEAKKGRPEEADATNKAGKLADANTSKQNDQYGSENTDVNTLEANSTPGSLSPAAQAQLAADQRKIGDTYANATSQGLKGIAQHGMGTLTGENSSLNNSMLRGQASDDLAAHEQAQLNTHADQLAAINARSQLQQIYNPNPAIQSQMQGALNQSRMGSTLGDIGSGLSTLATVGKGVVGMGGLNGIGDSLMNG